MPSTSRRDRVRARRRPARVVLPALLVLLLAGCSGEQSMLDPAGPYAEDPDNLFRLTFWIAVAVFVLVQGLIVYTAFRYRQKDDDDSLPVQTHGNTRLEIFWTVVPAIILAAIAVPTIQQVFDLAEEPDGALTVEVIGHRWWWEYRYPDTGVTTANELVIPEDRPIRLEMTADDPAADSGVLHSYWIPALAGKQDVIPGRTVTLNMQADDPGRYLGQCAEYCGLSHANMRNRAVVVTEDEFDTWIGEQQQPAVEPEEGSLEAQGRQILLGETGAANCAACHNIRTQAVDGESGFSDFTGPGPPASPDAPDEPQGVRGRDLRPLPARGPRRPELGLHRPGQHRAAARLGRERPGREGHAPRRGLQHAVLRRQPVRGRAGRDHGLPDVARVTHPQ